MRGYEYYSGKEKEMEEKLKSHSVKPIQIAKTGYIIISIIMCILGILFIMLPEESAVWLGYVCGIVLIICGIVRIIGYFSKDLFRLAFQYDLEFGIVMLVIGITMMFQSGNYMKIISIILGLAILIDGLFKARISIESKRFGITNWWLIMMFALIACAAGAFMIIAPTEGSLFLSVWIGISLLSEGLMNLFAAILTVKIVKNQKPDVIDVEYRNISDENEVVTGK